MLLVAFSLSVTCWHTLWAKTVITRRIERRIEVYEPLFRKYTKQYFDHIYDYRWFLAQAIQESNLNPEAVSWCGAAGIMQLMPKTAEGLGVKDRFDARWNIAGGIRYNRRLWDVWKAERTYYERLFFTFGSYNAGLGNILKAQRKALAANLPTDEWESIEKILPEVTGHYSKETINYVKRIRKIRWELRSSLHFIDAR